MHLISIPAALVAVSFAFAPCAGMAATAKAESNHASNWAVGSQYDSTHVYVASEDLDRFVTSFVGTFGGRTSKKTLTIITPTPSKTTFQFVIAPVGTLSVFGFQTPIPYPFGAERTGYLVVDLEGAMRTARADGAGIIVAPWPDAIGRDVMI